MSTTYKKRVIQQNSDSEESDGGGGTSVQQPPAKRVKPDDDAVPSTTTPTVDAAIKTAAAVATEEQQQKLAIFSTGASDESDEGSDDDDEEEKPLALTTPVVNGNGNGNGKVKKEEAEVKMDVDKEEEEEEAESSEDEKPLAAVVATKAKNAKASSSKSKKGVKKEESEEEEEEEASEEEEEEEEEEEDDADSESEEEPLAKKKKAAPAKKAPPAKRGGKDVKPDVKPATKAKAKAVVVKKTGGKGVKSEESSPAPSAKGKGKAAAGKGKVKDEEGGGDDEDEVYRWWDEENDGATKWKTLSHNGVLFPPEYEPHGVKMKYDGKSVTLPPEAEEVASFFAAILETDYPKNPVFVKNFFDSWTGIMKTHPPTDGTKITSFAKCDFTPIHAYLEGEKAKKKEMTAAQKKAAKAIRDVDELKYTTCLLDGRKEKVGNFRVEPPGLFRGRGEHPKTGLLKTRVMPEQITINIGKGEPIPEPPAGHQWKSVVHDDTVTWLATWKENINNAVKYVFLAAGSSLKGQSDFKKFEKARALKDHVDRIRRDYRADLKSKEMQTRQRATAMYLIDVFALRNGNEKGDDEADTVGCCSLRYEHITLQPPNSVTFDFLGKDSIRYVNTVNVDDQVFKNLKIFKKEPKTVGDTLFDRLTTGMVNKYLTSYMDGLTAKVFRTYNASWTFVQELKDTPKDASVADKILAYNRANRRVAVLCNHQRSVSKTHGAQMEKMVDKIRALKYQRMKHRRALHAVAEPKDRKKKYAAVLEEESDLEDDWIVSHESNLVALEREKIKKKFDKENAKLTEENEKPLPEKELKERLKVADDLEKSLKAERKAGYKESKLNEERLANAITKLDERIQVQKTNALDRDEGKEVSLGTSKINYLDPRITVAWAKANDVPLTRLLSKTLLTKFTWALEAEADFEW